MLSRFDAHTAKLVRDDMMKALQSVAEKYGLDLRGSGKYDPVSFTAKVEWKIKQTADGQSGEQVQFNRVCMLYGCTPEDYGKTLTAGGEEHILVGFNTRRPKFPVITRRKSDAKTILFTEHALRQIKPAKV